MKYPRAVLLLVGFALGIGSVLVVTRPSTTPPVTTGRSAADAAPAPGRPAAQVRLSAEARALADIRSEVPPLASAPRERATFGRVIDGGKLRAANRELQATSAALNPQHALTTTLNKRRQALSGFAAQGELTVARELARVELEYRREAATAQTQAVHLAALRAALRAQWGQTLAADDALFAPLATGAAQMIEFGAPARYRSLDPHRQCLARPRCRLSSALYGTTTCASA